MHIAPTFLFPPRRRCGAAALRRGLGALLPALMSALMLALSCLSSQAAGPLAVPTPELSHWFDTTGRPNAQARLALALLADAPSHGLVAEDYQTPALAQLIEQADREPLPDGARQSRLAQALTAALQRYLRDLHQGRLDPRQVHHDFEPPARNGFDADALLASALQTRRLSEAVQAAAPQLPLYGQLRQALAQLRATRDTAAWDAPLPPLPRPATARAGAPPKLEPGQAWAGLPLLTRRLQALGDLSPELPPPALLDGPLLQALQGFQQRHGLAPDGVIGRDTLNALAQTPAQRARQIELNLERLRWTPLTQAQRMVVINIPEFVLRAYEVSDGHIAVKQTMKVIVGKAMDTQTPLFDEPMRFIEFSPFWNVPPSIARKETVPRLRRDPGYLAREDMEFVLADGRIGTEVTPAVLADVLAGRARIRQRPGPKNALGEIKFVFPNSEHIYLHHTPSVSLFGRERRDFSHGCIRVEAPVALAMFVLQDMPQWSEPRVREAMAAGQLQTIRLATPVPVLIAYGTTLVKQGRLYVYPDIYGHDRALDQALRQRKPPTLIPARIEG